MVFGYAQITLRYNTCHLKYKNTETCKMTSWKVGFIKEIGFPVGEFNAHVIGGSNKLKIIRN